MIGYTARGVIAGLMVGAVLPAWSPSETAGQQIGITAPGVSTGSSYFERMGVSWGGRFGSVPPSGSGSFGYFSFGQGPGFNQGSVGGAIPPFGGYDPNSGARFGFSQINPGGGGFSLNFELAKGSSRSIVSSAPSLVVQNGFGGSIMSGGFRPFVTGLIPVVGGEPDGLPDNGVTRALSSGQLDLAELGQRQSAAVSEPAGPALSGVNGTANRGAPGVAAIRAARAARDLQVVRKVAGLIEEADKAIADGQPGLARTRLKQAAHLVRDPDQRREVEQRLISVGR